MKAVMMAKISKIKYRCLRIKEENFSHIEFDQQFMQTAQLSSLQISKLSGSLKSKDPSI
jgi:hypothetical protein